MEDAESVAGEDANAVGLVLALADAGFENSDRSDTEGSALPEELGEAVFEPEVRGLLLKLKEAAGDFEVRAEADAEDVPLGLRVHKEVAVSEERAELVRVG